MRTYQIKVRLVKGTPPAFVVYVNGELFSESPHADQAQTIERALRLVLTLDDHEDERQP